MITQLLNYSTVYLLQFAQACEGEECLTDRLEELATFALGLVGFFILGSFVTAAIMYITAGGNPEKIAHAKQRMARGFAGIVMLALFGVITRWVLVGV